MLPAPIEEHEKVGDLLIPVGRLFRPGELGDPPVDPSRLAGLVSAGELEEPASGLYWRGPWTRFGRVPPALRDVVVELYRGVAVGYSGVAAANGLGLTTQVPGVLYFAVPGLAEVPFPAEQRHAVVLVDRADRPARSSAGLRFIEVTALEALDVRDLWWEYGDDRCLSRIAQVLDAAPHGEFDPARLERGGRSEPDSVRALLDLVLNRVHG